MEHEQTPKQVQPEDTKTISIEERDAKREFNNNKSFNKGGMVFGVRQPLEPLPMSPTTHPLPPPLQVEISTLFSTTSPHPRFPQT